jgi:hypothetical protein
METYEALDGNIKVSKNNLYLFGDLVATNLRDTIAINLHGQKQYAHLLNNLEGVQIEKYGDSLYLNGEILTIDDSWLIVNKKYGDWHTEEEIYE